MLTVLAGGGVFPRLVADAVRRRGRDVLLACIRGEADPGLEAYPHMWVGRGQLGTLLTAMRTAGSRDLVIVGGIRQRRLPTWREVDLHGLWIVLRNLRLLSHGDDGLLRRVARLFESHGIRVLGAAEVAPDLLMPAGALGRVAPTAADLAAIAVGLAAARRHGSRDLGQGVVVAGSEVVLWEGPDGTDAMLSRFVALGRPPGERAILVKCPKPTQDMRLDMPAIGPQTVAHAAAAGLVGVAVEAGGTLLAEREVVAATADSAGLFVWGVAGGTP